MAQVAYSPVPDLAPQTEAPNDYQNVQPKAAEGLVAFGEGATKAGQFFGEAAADDASNNFQDGVTKILHGDPNKMVPGPDGQMQPDTGFLGLKGRAALDARPQVAQAMDALLKNTRAGLFTPAEQLQFDNFSRRYRSYAESQIGTHADQQATTWYGEVNTASAKNALDHISNNADNPEQIAAGAADLTQAYVKQAQLNGAKPGDPVWNDAITRGKRDALKAQVLAIGATDPTRALSILGKNRDIAGTDYEPLTRMFQGKADQQTGIHAGQKALGGAQATHAAVHSYADPSLPIYSQTAAAIPGGFSAHGIARTVMIESHGNPTIGNASGHVGLGQFDQKTWNQFGPGGDRRDPVESIKRIQLNAAQNARYLSERLGRPLTDAELYLAHQQGAGGAASLLRNPNALARDVVGTGAVLGNGGTLNMTAGQFAAMWTKRFDGTEPMPASRATTASFDVPRESVPDTEMPAIPVPQSFSFPSDEVAPAAPGPEQPVPGIVTTPPTVPAVPPSIKADAYQQVLDAQARGELTPAAAEHAITYINQRLGAEQIAAEADAKAKKDANEKAVDGYATRILKGDILGLDQEIANDPHLTGEAKLSLTEALKKQGGDDVAASARTYGPGFWSAYKQVSAPPGDPSRVADVGQLLRRAGPGGDLTLAGVQKLTSIMQSNTRSVDDQAVNTAKVGLLNYAKGKLSFEQDTGPVKIRDPEGERLFNARFIPKFEAAYDAWTKAGKDPWQFLTQDNVDKLSAGLRSPREMAMAKVAAQEQAAGVPMQPTPPAPAGVDPAGWNLVLNAPPKTKAGTPWPMANWQAAVTKLRADPSPEAKKWFDFHFAASGLTADNVIDVLTPPKAAK